MDKAGQVPAAAIAKRFIEAYYRVLHDNPELVHQFYLDHSEISRHGATGQADRVDAAGTQAIHDLISNCGFDKCTVLVDSADAQYSDNGAVVVMVAGHMGNKGQNRRPFVQTFVLARQNIDPPSFFVRNDVMRYTDTLPHLAALSAKPSSSPIPISSPPLSVPPNVSLDSKSPRPAVPSPRPAQPSPRPHVAPEPVQPEAAPVQAPQHEPEPEPSPPVEAEPAETEVVSASHSAQTLEPSQDQSLEAKPARKKREPRERRPKAPSAGAPSGTEEAKSKPRKKREGKKGKEETPAEQPAFEPAAGSPTPAASASAAPAPSPPMPPSSWAALVTKATAAPVGAPSAVPEKPSATTANGAKPKAPSAPKAAPSKTPNGVPAPAVASDDKANGRSSANEDEKWQKVEKRDRGGDKAGPEKGWEEQGVALFINALPPNATEDEIRDLFSAYGEIRFCQIPPAPKGACYVHFAAPESVTKVMDSRPFHLHGEKLNVQRRKPIRPDGPRSESARGRGGRGGSFRGRGRGGSARGGRPSDAGTPPSGDAAAPVSESRPRRGRPAASPVAAAQ